MTQMYRLLWLYSAVHGFAAVRGPADPTGPWPEAWRLALGRIATGTPPLVPAGPPEAVLARLEAELGERLRRLGPVGTAPALAGEPWWSYTAVTYRCRNSTPCSHGRLDLCLDAALLQPSRWLEELHSE